MSEVKSVIKKILNREELSEGEVYSIIIEEFSPDIKIVKENSYEHKRWTEIRDSIIQIENRYFTLWWESGLTEYQENYYPTQIAEEVRLQKKMIEITEWIGVE